MAPRFNRARLITADDRHYRQYVEQFTIARQNQRAIRPPTARDLFGSEVEEALRGWLSTFRPLADRRILEYEERRGRSWGRKYRELDAVSIDDRAIHVFEVKASKAAGSILRAAGQLADTAEILRMLFPQVATTIIFVDTGVPTAEQVAQLMSGPDAPPHPPRTIEQVLENLPHIHRAAGPEELREEQGALNLLLRSVDDIIALVGADALHLDWDAEEEPAEEPEQDPEEPEPQQAEAEEEDESPLAAALRKAMEQRDQRG